MSARAMRELLAEATHDIPAAVARPPLEDIRKRAVGRRILWPMGISGALSALVAGSALVLVSPGADTEPVPPAPVFAWSHAYAAKDGLVLTIYVARPGRCQTVGRPHATVSESDGAVTVTVTGEAVPVDDCTAGGSPEVTVRLGWPLGGRALRDGARDGDRPVFREEHLPAIPADSDWRPVPARQTFYVETPAAWHAYYTKPGGPDVSLDAFVTGTEPPVLAPAIDQIRLGSGDRALHPRGDTFQLVWEEGPIIYWLRLEPAEGVRMTEAQFREVVSGLTWP